MNYHDIIKDDMRNGEGLRVTLFVSGCEHHCPGCQNPQTWDADSGIPFDIYTMAELIDDLREDHIAGLTLSGGDPLHPKNREYLTGLCKRVKATFPEKDIWCYTGYQYEEVKDLPIMEYLDVLVDGHFVEGLADVKYHWAGSTNQRVIRLREVKGEGDWTETCIETGKATTTLQQEKH